MNWEEALELCEEILELVEELPDRAYEFAESVEEKTRSISVWIEDNRRVTESQVTALENMKRGAEKWLH